MHPWRKVASLLLTAEDATEFAKLRIVKKELVAWAREHGVDHRVDVKDGKRKDMSKPDLVKAVWSHAQTCECQLDEQNLIAEGVLIEITYQYLLPWPFFCNCPAPRRALYPTFPGYTFLPSSRRAAPRSQPAPVQEHLGRPLEPPSASEPASTPLACCTPWSGDPNDHTDGHRIIPCPWNRFHLCEVPMNRNHRIKLIQVELPARPTGPP
eukprot:g33615.t1